MHGIARWATIGSVKLGGLCCRLGSLLLVTLLFAGGLARGEDKRIRLRNEVIVTLAGQKSPAAVGSQSTNGNQLLWICAMMRWPARNTCSTSGIVNSIRAGWPGRNGSGHDMLWRNLPRNGSPRTICW